jgi:hypothetical protein
MTESASAIDLSSIDVKGALESMYVSKEDRVLDPTKADASLIERMPSPTGWRMLILPYRGKGKTAGGVLSSGQSCRRRSADDRRGLCDEAGPAVLQRRGQVSGRPVVRDRRLGHLCPLCWIAFPH